jgi:hypothetical protein
MYDAGKIITGLVVALVLLTFPFWYNLGSAAPPIPEPKLTAKAQAAGTCIASKDYMKKQHMQVLDDWRNSVVRDGFRYVVINKDEAGTPLEMKLIDGTRAVLDNTILDLPVVGKFRDMVTRDELGLQVTAEGTRYEMSLQNTCMDCHSSKKEFCDQCHDYAEVSPFCWDCHVQPEEKN